LSRVGCRADRLKDEFFAEIFATHPAVAELNDAEDRKEVEKPHHSVQGNIQASARVRGKFFCTLRLRIRSPTPRRLFTDTG
jgi:hypothetical protein